MALIVDDFDQLIASASAMLTLPIIMVSPILAFFTFFCLLDQEFALKDKLTVGLLWLLVFISILVLQLIWRSEKGVSRKIEFWLQSAQMICLVAACCALLASVMLRS